MAAKYQPRPVLADREDATDSFIRALAISVFGLSKLAEELGNGITTAPQCDINRSMHHFNAILEGGNALALSAVTPFDAADLGELRRQCTHLIVIGLGEDLHNFLLGELKARGLSAEEVAAVRTALIEDEALLEEEDDRDSLIQGN